MDAREGVGHPSPTFGGELEAELTARVEDNFCRWYVPAGEEAAHDCTWVAAEGRWRLVGAQRERVEAEVVPVLPERRSTSNNCLVHDGHLRFFRVRFLKDDVRQTAPTSALCHIQRAIRESAQALVGDELPPQMPLCSDPSPSRRPALPVAFDVGRECPLRALGLPPTPAMLDWHHRQMGGLGSVDGVSFDPEYRPVTYLVDTGVYDDVADTLEVRGGSSGHLDPHGSALAVLMRELSPGLPLASDGRARTEIESLNVFEDFTTTSAKLAAELEEVFVRHGQRDPVPPGIVNLSLGWPTLLTHPDFVRPLCGLVADRHDGSEWAYDGCTGEEGPLGGPVRFALALLRFGLESEVTSVAAPGNQPADLGVGTSTRSSNTQAARFLGRPGGNENICGGRPWDVGLLSEYQDDLMFYPAYWSRGEGRQNPLTRTNVPRTQLVVPAGARDHRGRRVRSTLPETALDFEVPGQHVYVPSRFLHPSNASRSFPPGSQRVRDATGPFPMSADPANETVLKARFALATSQAWTGTSISTALLSASLAEAHLAFQATRGQLGKAPGVRALLFATGVDVEGGRRPNLCRVRAALGAEAKSTCRFVVESCYEATKAKAGAWADLARTEASCERLPSVCKDEMGSCSTGGGPGPWGAPDGRSTISVAGGPALRCGGNPCIEVSASGSIGPQPGAKICPDCPRLIAFVPATGDLTLAFDINPALATGFGSPVVRIATDTGVTVSRTLPGVSIEPGASFAVSMRIPELANQTIAGGLLEVEVPSALPGKQPGVLQFDDVALE